MKAQKIVALVLAVSALAVTGACDLSKQVTAKSVVVATILSTPSVDLKPGAIAGLDASIPDAGLAFDAGTFDAGLTIPPQSIATVFFGQRQGESIDTVPTPVTGAKITLAESGQSSWTFTEQGQGNYTLGGPDAGFSYKGGATYNITIENQGTTYTAQLANAPVPERIPEFHPAAGFIDQPANQTFLFTRPEIAAITTSTDRNLGFVTVFPLDTSGAKGMPTYTNVPTGVVPFLKLILFPSEWRTESVTVPASAFPEANKNYVIVLQSAKLGKVTSDNLFAGSAIIGGTADVGVVKTR